jgi:NAD(P)H-hydrate epimerase
VLINPVPVLTEIAKEKKATILFKSHVLIIAAEDGRIGIVDGMVPVLAAGGSGDLLAGLCVGLAARMAASHIFDGYKCAAMAAALFIAAGKSLCSFIDPLELAGVVSKMAAEVWI